MIAGGLVVISSVSYYYRPLGDFEEGNNGPNRSDKWFMSKRDLSEQSNIPKPFIYRMSSYAAVVGTVLFSRCFMYVGGSLKIREDENYDNFVSTIRSRQKEVPVITVCITVC